VTRDQLRRAIADGSIEQLVRWQTVDKHEVISVPAGTIHAIGAGLVIAEIQQRSDATFRLFDYGRDRGLHVDDGASAAHLGAAATQIAPMQLSEERLLLVANAHFIFERIALSPGSHWSLDAAGETWLLAVTGDAKVGSFGLTQGSGLFAQAAQFDIRAGRGGVNFLVAYAGGGEPAPRLLQRVAQECTWSVRISGDEPNQARMCAMSP
jgi:mannose-6-phosphate isomerase